MHHNSLYMYGFDKMNSWNTRFISEQGVFPFVCLGAAVGSLETYTHVIPMPESHNLALVFVSMYTFNHFDMHKL